MAMPVQTPTFTLEPMRRIRIAIAGVVALCAVAALPAAAAADCGLPTSRGGANTDFLDGGTIQEFKGTFAPSLNGKFVQIPFEVGSEITGMKIRYCFDRPSGAGGDDAPTLDLGVYGPKPADADGWSQAERRGWSGSAVRTIGIGERGYTDAATYGTGDDSRKAYVPTYTSRAFKPGPIEPGQWAVELGAGWIDPDGAGVEWKVEVTTTTNTAWSTDPFQPDPYVPYVANPNAGWYTGDTHAHGEMEPGNALMTDTLDLGFKPAAQGGAGLDFVNLVDHNNDNSRAVLGSLAGSYPGKLIVPGVEVTTYNGHLNAQYSDNFADFRFSEVYRWDDENGDDVQTADELGLVRGKIDPASQLQPLLDGGGVTQVNHPETLRDAPAACRGCAWTYSDEQTDWSRVSSIEVSNGPGGIPKDDPALMNPFTIDAIELYERLLGQGFHIAAVASSDDHRAGGATGPFDSAVGVGATVVHATELSAEAVNAAVRAGHTYIKPFGSTAPDVELAATTPEGGSALPGDSVTGSGLSVKIDVNGAASAVRPGPFTLTLLKDGAPADSVAVAGEAFSHTFEVSEDGRYGFKLTRRVGDNELIEAYSTPVWFTYEAKVEPEVKPSNRFSFKKFKANRRKGIGKLRVKVASPGKLKLTGRGLKTVKAKVRKKNQVVTLTLRPKAQLKRKLRKRGFAKVKVKVTNTPTGGRALTKTKVVKLLAKKAKRKRR